MTETTQIHELVDGPNLRSVYRVETKHASYHFDFDARTLIRNPCEPDAAHLRGDMTHLDLHDLTQCKVGASLVLRYYHPDDRQVALRRSTPVTSIEAVPHA